MTKVITISPEQLAEKIETKLERKPGTSIKIKKAKLGKGVGLDIEYEKTVSRFIKNSEGIDELVDFVSEVPGEKFRFMPHEDLILAFNLLRSHLVILCDQREAYDDVFRNSIVSPNAMDDVEGLLDKYKVNGISIGGDGDYEGVTLVGSKKVRGGKVLNLVSPFTQFEDNNEDAYPYGDELQHLITNLVDEVEAYMNGKIAPDAQLSLFAKDSNDADLEEGEDDQVY